MNNQVILWSMLILPWLTLFFMKKEDIKRYMPAALFAAITSIAIIEAGETLKWWAIKETVYPLHNISYVYGMIPVLTMWLFRFTYGRFWLYMAIDSILNLGFTYLVLGYYLSNRGIFEYIGITPFQTFLIVTAHGILLYAYQIWQVGVFVRPDRTSFSTNLQPAAPKPLNQDEQDRNP